MATIAHAPRRIPPGRLIRRTPDWTAAGLAGIGGGIAFMLVEMLAAPLTGQGSLWTAPRAIASIVLGGLLDGQPTAVVLLVALFIHLNLSLFYGRVLAYALFRRGGAHWLGTGVLFGLGLYILNYYVLGEFVPRIAAARSASWLFCHLAFGSVAAGIFKTLENPAEEV